MAPNTANYSFQFTGNLPDNLDNTLAASEKLHSGLNNIRTHSTEAI